MKSPRCILISGIIIFLALADGYAQIKFDGGLESGYYKSVGPGVVLQNGFFTGLDGMAGYDYKGENRSASARLRARPELYGFDNRLTTLKLRGDVSYRQNTNTVDWGVSLTGQKYNFNSSGLYLTYKMFSLSGSMDFYFIKYMPAEINFGYAGQFIRTPAEQSLRLFYAEGKLYKSLSNNSRLGFGLYAERFNVKGSPPGYNLYAGKENNGWRGGPEIGFNYLGEGVLNLDYRFLIHSSALTSYPSIEHWIRLVAGRLLTSRLSVFLLADFYIRNFKYNADADKFSYLLYTAMNFDNRIYAKLGYELSGRVEVYLRSGYFNENLLGSKFNFEGWNALIGIDVSN